MTILFAVLSRIWPYLLGAVLLGAVYYKAQHWCNSVCHTARAERDTLQEEKSAAVKRAADLALLWSAEVTKTRAADAQAQERRNVTFTPVRSAVAQLPAAAAAVRVPAAVVRVLDAAAVAANAAGTATGPDQAAAPATASADSTGALLAGWFVVVAEIHAECRDRVRGWETYYEGLRRDESAGILEAVQR